MAFFVQWKIEIRVIQISLLCCPLRFDRLFPFHRVQTAGALSVHQCFCPQCHPDLFTVRLCVKNSRDGLWDPCTGEILGRQITGKLCVVRLRAGRDKLSQVKLHSTPHKRLLC